MNPYTLAQTLRACPNGAADWRPRANLRLAARRLRLTPAWNDILLPAALIGLRTVLNFVLDREPKMLDSDTPS